MAVDRILEGRWFSTIYDPDHSREGTIELAQSEDGAILQVVVGDSETILDARGVHDLKLALTRFESHRRKAR